MAKSEEEIQFYEKEYGIKREVREDGTCVFGGDHYVMANTELLLARSSVVCFI
jgi:hypothetical protein